MLKNSVQLVLCPGRNPDPEYIDIYNEIYSCWFRQWQATYTELKDKRELHSDNFTRQDMAAAIFADGKCLSLILFRHVDMRLHSTTQDSFFQHWGDSERQLIAEKGNHILVCGNFTIDPIARRSGLGFSMKELVIGISAMIALHSNAVLGITTPRKQRNVHIPLYEWGCTPLATDVNWGLGVTVDLVAFDKQSLLKNYDHELIPLIEDLWEKKLVVQEKPHENVNHFIHSNISKIRKAG